MQHEINEYLARRAAEGLSPASLTSYRERLERLAVYLRGRGLERWTDLTPEHLDAYAKALAAQGLAPASRRSFLACACTFLRGQTDRGLLPGDPAAGLTLPRVSGDDAPLPEAPLSEAEVAHLIEALPRANAIHLRDIALVELLYSAGLRISEALALDLRDLDFPNRVLHVRRGKGAKPRELPLLRGLFGALRNWLALRRSLLKGPDHGALLLNRSGQRLSRNIAARLFGKLERIGGLKRRLHPHLMRHSIAVHLLRGGADIRYVQAFLGHDDIESTRLYLRLVPADLRKAYDEAMPEVMASATLGDGHGSER
ncbi:MAG: tyrosine recombinase XerD [Planctomycetota bacterium]